MARRGLATALQAALAGFGGYGQGVVAQREREQKRLREEEETKRQALRDTLAQQQFGLQQEEFKARYGPEAIARAEREAAANREAELARTRISAGAAANVERMRQAEEARRDEAAGMAFLSANRSNPAVVNALGAIIGSNREFARRPGLAAAQLLKQSMSESEMDIKRATAGLPTREEMAGAGGAAGSAQAGGSVARRLQGGSYGATVGGQANAAKPTKEQRALDLISQGKSQAEIKRIMLAEGYTFND